MVLGNVVIGCICEGLCMCAYVGPPVYACYLNTFSPLFIEYYIVDFILNNYCNTLTGCMCPQAHTYNISEGKSPTLLLLLLSLSVCLYTCIYIYTFIWSGYFVTLMMIRDHCYFHLAHNCCDPHY